MPLCEEQEDQQHLWTCPYLSSANVIAQPHLKYIDLFGKDIGSQKLVMEIMFQRFEVRNKSCTDSAREPRGRSNNHNLVIRDARRGTRRNKQYKRITNKTHSS